MNFLRHGTCVLAAAAWLVTGDGWAIRGMSPAQDLVPATDAGVVGQLKKVHNVAGWGCVYGSGVIEVSEVLYGDLAGKTEVAVGWTFYPGISVATDVGDFDSPRIWLLVEESSGTYTTNYPKVLNPGRRAEVLNALSNPLQLRPVDQEKRDGLVSLVYRNYTGHGMELPAVELKDGRLVVSEGTSFSVRSISRIKEFAAETTSGTLEQMISFTSAPRMISLAPGEVVTFDISPRDVFEGVSPQITLRWGIDGVGESNELYVTPLDHYDSGGNGNPLWLNLGILMRYSPTREAFGGLLLGCVMVFFYVKNRKGLREEERHVG